MTDTTKTQTLGWISRLLQLAVMLCATGAWAQETYVNDRYDVMAVVPSGFGKGHPSSSGDGAEFTHGVRSDSKIAIYGNIGVADDPLLPDDIMANRANRLASMEREAKVSYAPFGADWYVLSGTKPDGVIIYARTVRFSACDGRTVFGTIHFEYPAQDSDVIAPLIGPAAQTLGATPCQ